MKCSHFQFGGAWLGEIHSRLHSVAAISAQFVIFDISQVADC